MPRKRIMRAARADVPLIAKIERPAGARAPRRDPRGGGRRDGGARRSRARVPARADPAHPEDDHRARARARTAGDPRHAGARVDAHRAAARRARKSATRRPRSIRGPTRSCWPGKPPPATIRSRRSRRSIAIIRDAETVAAPAALLGPNISLFGPPGSEPPPDGFDAFRTVHGRAMCEAAVTLASTGQAEAIVAVTLHGKTAQLLSSLRPAAAHRRGHAVRRGRAPAEALLGRPARRLGPRGPARARSSRSARRSTSRRTAGGRVHQHQPGPEPGRRQLPQRAAARRLDQR